MYRQPPSKIILKSCDGHLFTCSCLALSYSFRFFSTMLDLPLPADAFLTQEVGMTEQAIVLQKLLDIVDPSAAVNEAMRPEYTDTEYLATPQTTRIAGEEDAPPEAELEEMEGPFRLVALVIEAAVKFEATKLILDSLAWQLKPYAAYRPLQAYALAAKLDHVPIMSEISAHFINYNLNIVKQAYWTEIGALAALRVYQLHYARSHHVFHSLQHILAEEAEVGVHGLRCKQADVHRNGFLRILGDWLACPGHDWQDLQTWMISDCDICPDCSPRWAALVGKAKERFKGPEVLMDVMPH